MTEQDCCDILDQITLPDGWRIRHMAKGDGWLIQIVLLTPDIEFPESDPIEQRCRKWYVSSHATRTEVVRTVYKAGLAALEHEFGETFKYKGVAIYHPHRSVESMLTLGKDVRPPKPV